MIINQRAGIIKYMNLLISENHASLVGNTQVHLNSSTI